MKSVEELQGEKNALVDEAYALAELAKAGEDLTDDQSSRLDDLTGDNGLIEKAEAERAAAEKFRDMHQALAEQRAASVAPRFGGVPAEPTAEPKAEEPPRVALKNGRSKHFADQREAYLSGCWLQAVAGVGDRSEAIAEMNRLGWEEYAVQTEGVGNKGGYFVPEPVVNEIIRNRDTVGVAPQLCRTVSMSSETLTLFEETGQQSVYYPGEGGAITASDATFEKHTLTVKKRAAITKISPELLADSPMSAADIVVNSMAYKMAYQLGQRVH